MGFLAGFVDFLFVMFHDGAWVRRRRRCWEEVRKVPVSGLGFLVGFGIFYNPPH
jgi:hypothetical protein